MDGEDERGPGCLQRLAMNQAKLSLSPTPVTSATLPLILIGIISAPRFKRARFRYLGLRERRKVSKRGGLGQDESV